MKGNTREKTELKFFNIMQYEEEAEYLRGMHTQGWKLTGVNFPGIYHFAETEPEDMVYQLDYSPNGRENKEEYVQMFSDCGWEYLFDFVGYSYFRKPASEMEEDGEEGIFCSDESRLDMVLSIMKNRMLPLLVVFCLIILPQCWRMIFHFEDLGGISLYLTILYLGLFVAYVAIFAWCGIAYLKFRKKTGEKR